MADFIPYRKLQERILYLSGLRNPLFKGRRIRHYNELPFLIVEYLSYRRSPLHPQCRLVVALLQILSRIRKEEHLVSFYKIIKVSGAVFRRLLVRQDDQLHPVMIQLGHDEPSGRQKQPAAEDFRGGIQFFRKFVYGFRTY